ncbi:MAG: tetratricopeptide repeat protein, partial [Moorea sp. SIO4E2]|uniref:tetratricopeptide repeat protein n=1 Tax=Moorena sp. SIO4E2 TaxID=2607826 RepID=UPI0013BB43E6
AFGLENKHSGERRHKRSEVVALVAKYKPELLSDQTPEEESDLICQLPTMPRNNRELFLKTLDNSVSDEHKRKQFAKNLNKVGYEHYMIGDFQSALFYLEWATAFDPNHGPAHYNLGSTYEELEKPDRARFHYQTATECKGRAVDAAINNLARLEILEGNIITAIDLLLPSLKRVEDASIKFSLHKNLGWAYLQQNHYHEAELHLRKALELDSYCADAYYLLAQVQEAQGNKQNADLSWENGFKYDSRNNKSKKSPWRLPELDSWKSLARQRLNAKGEK